MTDETTHALAYTPEDLPRKESFLKPHRIVLMLLFAALVVAVAVFMRWDWLPRYLPRLGSGILVSLAMLFSTAILGFLLAVPLGLAQVTGPRFFKAPARIFCTVIRGTPLLLQLWLLYYGLGSLFPQFPAIRQSFLWP
ncbi:ABC transporter permease subunit, partial [Sinorhizobium meliloti]